jgi:type 1 fimbriae regulatory protein FimE
VAGATAPSETHLNNTLYGADSSSTAGGQLIKIDAQTGQVLRVSELVSLRWDQADLRQGLLHVTRLKHGIASVHPLRGPELRTLRRLQRDYPDTAYVFVSERKAPLTADTVRKIVGRAGQRAGIEFPVHPHMLRHATGYKLANDGQDTRSIQHYLGHRNIEHTTRYTELRPDRFRAFWSD